jgi:cobalamin biosynthesis Mg chelatase CobN
MQSSVTTVELRQNVNVVNYGTIDCDRGFTITQDINNYNQIKNTFASERRQELISQLQNLIDNQSTQVNKEVLGFLAKEPNASNIVDITNRIKSVISTTLTETTLQSILNQTQAYQETKVINYGTIKGYGCTINQNIFVQLFAYAVLNAVSQSALNEKIVNTAVNTIEQQLETKSEGITGLFMWIAIIVGALVLLVIVGAIVYLIVTRRGK